MPAISQRMFESIVSHAARVRTMQLLGVNAPRVMTREGMNVLFSLHLRKNPRATEAILRQALIQASSEA